MTAEPTDGGRELFASGPMTALGDYEFLGLHRLAGIKGREPPGHVHRNRHGLYHIRRRHLSTAEKSITQYGNNKSWSDNSVRFKLTAKNDAYKNAVTDPAAFKPAKFGLKRSTKAVQINYRYKLEVNLDANYTRDVWQGLNQIVNYTYGEFRSQ